MNRRTLLQTAGLAGIATLIPFRTSSASQKALRKLLGIEDACTLIPTKEAGPYPWPSGDGTMLSLDKTFYRQDITEGNPGVPFTLTLTVINTQDNCKPLTNANVVIWHCSKDGLYSEYVENGVDETGKTFFRGIQMTDANGQVTFKTVYPGWYAGRITHIHVQVFLGTVWNVTSQVAFPEMITQTVYNSPLYVAKGQNTSVASNSADHVFSTDLASLLLNVTGDVTNGYTGTLTIPIAAPVNIVEPETGGQFTLGQNYPNPFAAETTIPFTLVNSSTVLLEIFDMNGKKIAEPVNQRMNAGAQKISIGKKLNGILLTDGAYVYQLTVQNEKGTFRQSKVMTLQ